jgi:hypothetical protein
MLTLMNTHKAIKLAGGGTEGRRLLAEILGVKAIATYKWKPNLPEPQEWKLRVLKPEWFKEKAK